jgi:hypothetical protein
MIFEVPEARKIEMAVLWNVMPFSLVLYVATVERNIMPSSIYLSN